MESNAGRTIHHLLEWTSTENPSQERKVLWQITFGPMLITKFLEYLKSE